MNTSHPFVLSFAPAKVPCNLDTVIEREHQVQQPGDLAFRWYEVATREVSPVYFGSSEAARSRIGNIPGEVSSS